MTSDARRGSLVEWTLVLLAWASAALALWLAVWEPTGLWRTRALGADTGISAAFLVAIGTRWLRFRIGRIYLLRHWWEIVALVPFVAFQGVAGWHWIGYAALAARVVRVAERTDNVLGDRITGSVIAHFSKPIVDAIKRPVTIAVLDEVIDVIGSGDYATNVSHALEENRAELEALILDLLKRDRTTGRLKFVPFHDEVVTTATDTVFRIVQGALADPRVHELIADVIRNSATQLRSSVRTGAHQ